MLTVCIQSRIINVTVLSVLYYLKFVFVGPACFLVLFENVLSAGMASASYYEVHIEDFKL